ncbi:SNF2-related protein [Jannaschia sp. R86511]|uniref:DEAD/DEAH box helicase n=1 Tax=Jannaschia sp. R86511 TaxID=3093853 RepID=UPI0036D2B5F1
MTVHWTEAIDDDAIRAVVGEATFDRGEAYAREGRVQRVSGTGGGALLGEVRGSGRGTYSTLVTPTKAASARRPWTGRCSCPVGADCKHAVAVLIAARAVSPGTPPGQPPAGPGWEDRIGRLVRSVAEPEDEPQGAPLALQLEVVDPAPGLRVLGRSPDAPAPPRRRVLLRPVVQGVRGAWVRGGASWRELEHGFSAYGRPVPDPRHREALLELFGLHQARARSRYGVSGEPAVHLDEVGPSAWQVLLRLLDAGVQLLTTDGEGDVVVADAPGAAAVDLRRDDPDGDATLEAVLTLAGDRFTADSVCVVGSPAHGYVVEVPSGSSGARGAARRVGPGAESLLVDSLLPAGGLLLVGLDAPATPQLSQMLHEGHRLDIPAADLPRFLREYYPGLRQVLPVTSSDDSVPLPQVQPPTLVLALTYLDGHRLALSWQFDYRVGEESVRVPLGADAGTGPVRDRVGENEVLAALTFPDRLDEPDRAQLPQLWTEVGGDRLLVPRLTLAGLDTVAFTNEVLPVLRDGEAAGELALEVSGTPTDYRYTEVTPVIELRTTESGERDWFDLGVTVSVDGEDIPFEPLFVALANGETHLVLDSGTWFSIDRPELEQLRVLIDEARGLQDKDSGGLRISAYQADLWDELTQLGVVQEQSARWTRAVQGLLDVSAVPEVEVPQGLDANLRPYQLDGYQWLAFLQEHELGGVLADDMGLGKTVQALAMVLRAVERGERSPFLVVAPTSVVPNWVHEAARFAPGLVVREVSRTTAKSGVPLTELADGAHVVVTSYALFRLDNDSYEALEWAGLLLDEAQFVKNHQGRTHVCARRLRAPFKLAITGTPLENNLMELWSLLSIVAPGLYPNPKRFAQQYATPIGKGDTEALARLRRRVRPLMRRRTKEQVATELPPKVEQVLEVTLNAKHRRIYQTHLQRERQKVLRLIDEPDRNRFAILRSITLLRRLCLDPALVDETYAGVAASKVDVLAERLHEVIEEGHRALVFSQFTGFLASVRARLEADGIAYSYLDGSTRDRSRRLEAFRAGDDPVFLISLKAGGVGLNLTEADYCFILDPWWNPAVEAQAVDRTHRIGQGKTVMVYRLVATDTIEDKVMQLKERKLELFSSVMDDGGALGGALTGEDIAGLLEP